MSDHPDDITPEVEKMLLFLDQTIACYDCDGHGDYYYRDKDGDWDKDVCVRCMGTGKICAY